MLVGRSSKFVPFRRLGGAEGPISRSNQAFLGPYTYLTIVDWIHNVSALVFQVCFRGRV
jgi:hypothetical protein